MVRAAIYGVAIVLAVVAVKYTESPLYWVLLVLSPLVYGVIGAMAAVLFLPIRISWVGVVGFALFYTSGCILFIVALTPIVPMGLARTISSGLTVVAVGSGLVVLLLATGMVFLALARGCLLRFSQTTPPNAPKRALWTPALAISFATVTALAPAVYASYLESKHQHVAAHTPSSPDMEVVLLWAIPIFILVLCHDFMFRRALDHLFWGRSFMGKNGLVLGLARSGLILGGIFVLSLNALVG